LKRKIKLIRKPASLQIAGVARLQEHAIYVGMPCPADQGGGFVADMELVGGSTIAIRKVDDKGQPVRRFGKCPLTNRSGNSMDIEGDGVLVAMSALEGVVFEDVPEEPKQKQAGLGGLGNAPDLDPPPAKPIQAQPRGK